MKKNGLFVHQLAIPVRAADDRCQWQVKGGRPHIEREMSANKVKRESAARCGKAIGTFSGLA